MDTKNTQYFNLLHRKKITVEAREIHPARERPCASHLPGQDGPTLGTLPVYSRSTPGLLPDCSRIAPGFPLGLFSFAAGMGKAWRGLSRTSAKDSRPGGERYLFPTKRPRYSTGAK